MSQDASDGDGGPTAGQFGIVLLLVGLLVAGFGGYDYVQQDRALEDAVTVEATVLETGVDESSATSRSDTSYSPVVRFRYDYEGTTYTSTEIDAAASDPSYDTAAAAREAIADYDADETVTAYVVPDRPGEAFLEAERSNTPLYMIAVGIVFGLGGARMLRRG